MNNRFFRKLALTNLKNNLNVYLPYAIAAACSAAGFYIMLFLTTDSWVMSSASLSTVMALGCIVIAVFSLIFLFYTNSFLIKRRKKEIGLYNVLGLEKKHIARVMVRETFYVAAISIISGIILGILLSRLSLLLLAKILGFNLGVTFYVSLTGAAVTALYFICIFAATLIYNICSVRAAKPVELLRGGNVGEREPKTKWIMAVIGVICLGVGYYIAITTESPLTALALFFVAVILVIIGTYCIFTAGSIAVLKALRAKKSYYYTPKHFSGVSGMIYRMKQNAVGLASICILSTMVLVMISTTSCLFLGFDDVMDSQYPREIEITVYNATSENMKAIAEKTETLAAEKGYSVEGVMNYRYREMTYSQNGGVFAVADGSTVNYAVVSFLPLSDYIINEGTDAYLPQGEIFIYSLSGKTDFDTVEFNGKSYKVAAVLDKMNVQAQVSMSVGNAYFVVVPSETDVTDICGTQPYYVGDDENGVGIYEERSGLRLCFAFDSDAESDTDFGMDLLESMRDNTTESMWMSTRSEVEVNFLGIYGGLFFLGIFLGTVFMIGTVLIIYYKQISEGYDDKERFAIMKKVGMSDSEVKKTIHSQVLTVFYLPLAAAVIHLAFAFKFITRLMRVLSMFNVPLFAVCTAVTVGVFALFYTAVYLITARAYSGIVRG